MYLFQFQVIFSEVSQRFYSWMPKNVCCPYSFHTCLLFLWLKLLKSAASQLQVDRLCSVSQTQSIVFASPVNLSGVVCAALLCSWLFSLNVSKSACVFFLFTCAFKTKKLQCVQLSLMLLLLACVDVWRKVRSIHNTVETLAPKWLRTKQCYQL